jgi:hypothetical protein
VATWDDVARVCLALPGTTEAVSASGRRRWLVCGKTFLRERPLHRKDLTEIGDAAPDGPVLVRLERLDEISLRELAADAWAARAPRRLVAENPLGSG